jgi:hypothetical protein
VCGSGMYSRSAHPFHPAKIPPLPGREIDQPIEAIVDRDIGVEQAFQDIDRSRIGLGEGGIGAGWSLWCALGPIDANAAMIDAGGGIGLNWLTADTIAIHECFGAEGVVRKLCKGVGGTPLGVIQHFVEIGFKLCAAISFQQRSQTAAIRDVWRPSGLKSPEISLVPRKFERIRAKMARSIWSSLT